MSSANIGWMFYKENFFQLDDRVYYHRDMQSVNNDILKANKVAYSFSCGTHNSTKLTTIYPGLLVGTGYIHSLKNTEENFDFGFYFDHTTGMPVIPGSSIKGVLRSYFGQGKGEKYKQQKEEFIKMLLPTSCALTVAELDAIIFDGKIPSHEYLSTYQRDIFYDAIVAEVASKLFYDDYITPHDNPLKEPVPNRLLKVAPEVTYQFSFDLHDIQDNDGNTILSAQQKEKLFLELLLYGGVGAKTNVGYGQFRELTEGEIATNINIEKSENESPTDRILEGNKLIDIIGSYETGFKERVAPFKDDFKKEILNLLGIELAEETREKKQAKIKTRIEKVKNW